jgi:PAS domain S-box-containing protein
MIKGEIGELTEEKFVRLDGKVIDVEVIASAVNYKGDIIFQVIARDITERKKLEMSIRESQQRFRLAFECSSTGIALVDLKGKFIQVNSSFAGMMGYTTEELINKEFQTITHPDDIALGIEEFGKMLRGEKENVVFEKRYLSKNKQVLWVQISATILRDPDENPLYFIAHFNNITQRKEAESVIKENERKYRAIVESAIDGFYLTDREGSILETNDAFCKMTNYTREELLYMNICELQVGSRNKDIIKQLDWIKKNGGDKYPAIYRINGWEEIDVEVSTSYSPADEGRYFSFISDVSDKNRMLRDLVKAKESAEKANKLKSEFLAQISHEIRSPLGITLSYTNLIKDELRSHLTEELKQCFAAVDTAGQRIIRTVDLILNMSEMQVGTYEPRWEKINIEKEILNPLFLQYSVKAKNKNLQFNLLSAVEEVFVSGDKYSINQIFGNLIDNAIKYTDIGVVKISVDYNEVKKVKVVIEDSGIGISPDYMTTIFEPFMQEQQGYSRKYDGNGLGLALVKKYCELNNAEIKVESEKGTGSIFSVIFPIG